MKKLISLVLGAAMLLSVCCGCGAKYAEALNGTWVCYEERGADDTEENLSDVLAFYDSEIACADLESCSFAYTISFNAEDGTYYIGEDDDLTRESVRSYLDSFFDVLYENRTGIEDYYGLADDCASAEEFKEWYATEVFSGYDDYAAMLDDMTDTLVSNYTFEEETGTYTANAKEIRFTADGDNAAEKTGYTLDGDTLTIEYADETVDYTLVQ